MRQTEYTILINSADEDDTSYAEAIKEIPPEIIYPSKIAEAIRMADKVVPESHAEFRVAIKEVFKSLCRITNEDSEAVYRRGISQVTTTVCLITQPSQELPFAEENVVNLYNTITVLAVITNLFKTDQDYRQFLETFWKQASRIEKKIEITNIRDVLKDTTQVPIYNEILTVDDLMEEVRIKLHRVTRFPLPKGEVAIALAVLIILLIAVFQVLPSLISKPKDQKAKVKNDATPESPEDRARTLRLTELVEVTGSYKEAQRECERLKKKIDETSLLVDTKIEEVKIVQASLKEARSKLEETDSELILLKEELEAAKSGSLREDLLNKAENLLVTVKKLEGVTNKKVNIANEIEELGKKMILLRDEADKLLDEKEAAGVKLKQATQKMKEAITAMERAQQKSKK